MFQSRHLLTGEYIGWNAHFIYYIQLNMPDQPWELCDINQQGALFYTAFINSHWWHLFDNSGVANVNKVTLIKIPLKHLRSLDFNELLFMAFQFQQSAHNSVCADCVSAHRFLLNSNNQSARSFLLTKYKACFNLTVQCKCSHSQLLASCIPARGNISSHIIY